MNNKIIVGIISVIIIAGVAFYSGIMYQKSTISVRGQFTGNLSDSKNIGIRGNVGGGFTAGEIISKDATSITIKMQDGSTKIILVTENTQVIKSSSGLLDDLTIGTDITITGATNSDGSITAKSVQIRPTESLSPNNKKTN